MEDFELCLAKSYTSSQKSVLARKAIEHSQICMHPKFAVVTLHSFKPKATNFCQALQEPQEKPHIDSLFLRVKFLQKVIALEQLTSHIERRPTTTETRVAYDNSTWHVINSRYINSTKETSHARRQLCLQKTKIDNEHFPEVGNPSARLTGYLYLYTLYYMYIIVKHHELW